MVGSHSIIDLQVVEEEEKFSVHVYRELAARWWMIDTGRRTHHREPRFFGSFFQRDSLLSTMTYLLYIYFLHEFTILLPIYCLLMVGRVPFCLVLEHPLRPWEMSLHFCMAGLRLKWAAGIKRLPQI